MNDNPTIRSSFEQRYKRLLFDLYPLEHGWRRFEAISRSLRPLSRSAPTTLTTIDPAQRGEWLKYLTSPIRPARITLL